MLFPIQITVSDINSLEGQLNQIGDAFNKPDFRERVAVVFQQSTFTGYAVSFVRSPSKNTFTSGLKSLVELYRKVAENAIDHFAKYRLYLTLVCNSNRVDLEAYRKSKEGVADYYRAIYRFKRIYKQLHSSPGTFSERARINIEGFLTDIGHACKSDSNPFEESEVLKWAGKYRSLIQLEEDAYGPFNLPLVKLISENYDRRLKDDDLQKQWVVDLRKWIDQFTQYGNVFDVRNFHKAIKVVVAHLNAVHRIPGTPEALYERFADALEKVQKGFMHLKDPLHWKWRESLKAGDPIYFEGKLLMLGRKLGQKKVNDNNLIYEVEGKPEHVLWIATNKEALPYLYERSEGFAGIPIFKFEGVASSGHYALIEKLYPLDHYQWESDRDFIKSNEATLLDPVLTTIKFFLTHSGVPSNFKLQALMLNKERELRAVVDGLRIPGHDLVDPIAFEEVLLKVANGNLFIFKYLMQNSRILNLRDRKLFQLLLGSVTETNTYSEKEIYEKVYSGPHESSLKRAKVFYKELLSLKKMCLAECHKQKPLSAAEEIESNVCSAIASTYDELKCFSVLWPTAKELVIEKVNRALK